jgi:pimeloyl-ACP methyl ester carboxylesterase
VVPRPRRRRVPPLTPAPLPIAPDLLVAAGDGARLGVFEVAPADAGRTGLPPLLLVHGATADHTTFREVGPRFAATRRAFAMDRRGRGASTDGPGYTIELEFDDVALVAAAIARELQVQAVDVAGHSYGGRCALGASLRTAAIRRVVVYEGAPVPPGMSYRPPGLVEAVRVALERGDDEGALTTFLAGIVGLSEAELAAYRANPVWPQRVAAAPTILREIEAETSPAASLDALGHAGVPVLLLFGSVSRSPFRIGTEALAARLAQVEIAVIEGAAHAAHHTHAEEFVRVVEAFLDRS